jgi:hypothetical protein
MPLLHRRSYTRSDFRRLALPSTCDASRLRGLDLRRAAFFESGYSPRPKPLPSSNFTLLQDFRSLDVGHRSHGGLPLYVTRSIFDARMHLLGGRIRQSPSRYRSSVPSREDTGAILVQDSKRSRASFEHRITSRNTCKLSLTQQARSRPWPDLLDSRARHLLGVSSSEALSPASPCGDSSVRSRCSDFAPSIAVSRVGALFRMRSSFRAAKLSRISDHFALVEAAHDRIPYLSMREIVLTAMHALLLMPAYVLAHLAAFEPTRPHVRSRRRRQLSCSSSSRDAPFVFPRRGRRGVSCPRSLHDSSFDVRAPEARGCASCFSLLGVHDLSIASAFGSRRSPFTLRGRAHARRLPGHTAGRRPTRIGALRAGPHR